MAELQGTLDELVEHLSLKNKAKTDKAEGKAEEKADEKTKESIKGREKYKVQEKAEEIVWNAKKLLFFDLETTGLEKDCDIVQISAILGYRAFDQYVFPTKKICPRAAQVNGLAVKDGELYYKENRVVSIDTKAAMESFVIFLKDAGEQVVLVAHNGHRFDVPHLLRVMGSVGVQLPSNVSGFLDSMLLAKVCYPGRKSYTQLNLVSDILGVTYEAHNAAADVKTLQSLMGAMLGEGSKQTDWGKCFKPRTAVEK